MLQLADPAFQGLRQVFSKDYVFAEKWNMMAFEIYAAFSYAEGIQPEDKAIFEKLLQIRPCEKPGDSGKYQQASKL